MHPRTEGTGWHRCKAVSERLWWLQESPDDWEEADINPASGLGQPQTFMWDKPQNSHPKMLLIFLLTNEMGPSHFLAIGSVTVWWIFIPPKPFFTRFVILLNDPCFSSASLLTQMEDSCGEPHRPCLSRFCGCIYISQTEGSKVPVLPFSSHQRPEAKITFLLLSSSFLYNPFFPP